MPQISIRPLKTADRATWEVLWRENLAHFAAGDTARQAMPAIWQRLMAPGEPLAGWLLCLGGAPAGLAHVVLRYHTFSARPVGILEDLWITETARRRGLAQALIAYLVDEGRARGWSRLEWETAGDNLAAQALYDRLADAPGVRRYQVTLA